MQETCRHTGFCGSLSKKISNFPIRCVGYAGYKFLKSLYTSWFVDDARPPAPSAPYIIKPFEMLPTFCRLPAIASPSPGVWVDGVDGWEFGEGPMVFPVPVLLAAPEDEGPFLFRLFYYIINNKSPTCKK